MGLGLHDLLELPDHVEGEKVRPPGEERVVGRAELRGNQEGKAGQEEHDRVEGVGPVLLA